MALRLDWYQRRCQGKLHSGEQVVAAVHAHTSYLMMLVMPSLLDPLIGRHVVVTNERVLIFGPAMRSVTAEYPRGAANAVRTSFHLTIGDQKMFVGGMIGPMSRIVDQVVDNANSSVS
jgi:hypothetical protein